MHPTLGVHFEADPLYEGQVPGKTAHSMTLRKILLLPFNIIVAILILLDEVARPVYRPRARWLASLRLVEAAEAQVARLNRYVILVLLAVPFAIAEPLKIYGVLMLGEGHFIRGIVILALAYLASFLLIERIYHAGRDKLLSIGWFGWIMGQITRVRAALTAWVKDTALLEGWRPDQGGPLEGRPPEHWRPGDLVAKRHAIATRTAYPA